MTFSITQYVNLYVWQFNARLPALSGRPVLRVVLMFVIVGPAAPRAGASPIGSAGRIRRTGVLLQPLHSAVLAGPGRKPAPPPPPRCFTSSSICANTASVVSIISATSMVAEIVEAFEERTGKRAEGTFYSGNWLVQKCATGGGILLTSLGRSIDLAPGTPQAEVAQETVTQLVGALRRGRCGARPDRRLLARPLPDLTRAARGPRGRPARYRFPIPTEPSTRRAPIPMPTR